MTATISALPLARVPARNMARLGLPSNVLSRHLADLRPYDQAWLPIPSRGASGVRWKGPFILTRSREIWSHTGWVGFLVDYCRWTMEDSEPFLLIRDEVCIQVGAWVSPGRGAP